MSLSLPNSANPHESIPDLVETVRGSQVPIDISSNPALWGGHMRGADECFLTQLSSFGYENANDDRHACDLIQAHLIETLSSLGREWIDIYFLRVRQAVEEYQISGVLEALEHAKQEGHVRFIGLCCDGPAMASLGLWQFHDAFEVLQVPRNHYDDESYRTLSGLAKERRVGVVTSRPLNWGYGLPFTSLPTCPDPALAQAAIADLAQDHPVLVGVRSAKEAEDALSAVQQGQDPQFRTLIEPVLSSFDQEDVWNTFAESRDQVVRRAFERRQLESAAGAAS